MKYLFCIFIVLLGQKIGFAQCSSGNCNAPQYYPQYQSSYSTSYPIYSQNYPVYSGIVYETYPASRPIYATTSGQVEQSQKLVPVIKKQPAPLATPTISGPSTIKVGELAVLRIKDSPTKVVWIVIPQKINFKEFENGSSAVFSSPSAGIFSFFAACGSGNDLIVLPHNLTVIDDRPSPGPSPPGPNPQPIDLKSNVRLAIDKVKSQKKIEEAQFLAFSFLSVVNLIKTGIVTDSAKIIQITTDSNRQVLGQAKEKWIPFFTDLALILNNLSKNGQLKTPEEHIEVWNTIAETLKETL